MMWSSSIEELKSGVNKLDFIQTQLVMKAGEFMV